MSVIYRKTWKTGETVTPNKANTFFSEPVERMFNRNMALLQVKNTVPSAHDTANTGGFVPFTPRMVLHLETGENENVRIWVQGNVDLVRTSGSGIIYYRYDVLIDDSFFVSSLSDEPTTDGMFTSATLNLFPYHCNINAEYLVSELEAGEHTFELYARPADTGHTMKFRPASQFGVESYGTSLGQIIAANPT